MTGAFIASHLRHISGYDTLELATILHTKDKLRFMLEAKGHPSPKRYTLEQASKIVSKNQPLIIKPVDNSSGIGIATARSITELELGVSSSSLASKSSAVVIEDYILGDLVSHSAFIAEGKIYQDFFVNEFCTVYPYQVNSSCHPSNIEDKIKESISNTMQQIISDAGLVNGLLHTQIIISDSSWYIIESMRRAPGDLYGHLIVKSTIFPYWLHYIQPFLGISSSTTGFLSTNRNKLIARHTITCSSQCYPDSYRIHLPSKELEVFQLQASSQRLNKAPFDKKAHLFFEFSEKHELHYYTQRLNKFINLHVH
jgi:formate-dependent phosphoribosylglycinamide formyltransferase (GAR transformylase)